MYHRAKPHFGIDSIKFRIENYLELNVNLQDSIIEEIKHIFKDNDNIEFQGNRISFIDENKQFCKINSQSKYILFIELYGLTQYWTPLIKDNKNKFKYGLLDEFKQLIEYIINLKYGISITKLDFAVDLFYDYNLTLVGYKKQSDNNTDLNNQNNNYKEYINKFLTHSLYIPIDNNENIIDDLLSKRDLLYINDSIGKLQRTKSSKRYVKQYSTYNNHIKYEYSKDKQSATHLELKLRDREIYNKYYRYLVDYYNMNIGFITRIDSDEDIELQNRKNYNSVSIIKYDKTYKDNGFQDLGYDLDHIEDFYNKVSEFYSNNDDEYDYLKDNIKHSRLEYRLYKGGKYSYSLKLKDDIDKMISDIIKEIERTNIYIFKDKDSMNTYIRNTMNYQLFTKKLDKNGKRVKRAAPLKTLIEYDSLSKYLKENTKKYDVYKKDVLDCLQDFLLCFTTVKSY